MKQLFGILGVALTLTSVAYAGDDGARVRWDGHALTYHTPQGVLPATVRAATEDDINDIVVMNRENYGHDNTSEDDARRWIKSHFDAKDFTRYYVITATNDKGDEGEAVGYVLWSLDGGYHPLSTAKLEQFGTRTTHRGQGFAHALLRLSLKQFEKDVLGDINGSIDRIYGTLGSDFKEGRDLFKDVFGLEEKGKVGALYNRNPFGEEEVFYVNERVQDFTNDHPLDKVLD